MYDNITKIELVAVDAINPFLIIGGILAVALLLYLIVLLIGWIVLKIKRRKRIKRKK